jgi:Flp pilus assembly pilin Flp
LTFYPAVSLHPPSENPPTRKGRTPMMKALVSLQSRVNSLREEDGNAAEYGLIIAGVAVVIIVGLGVLAAALNGLFGQIATAL